MAIALAVLSLLPIANWIPGGHSAGDHAMVVDVWLGGTLIAVGLGVLLAVASRRVPRIWRPDIFCQVIDRWRVAPRQATAWIAIIALGVYSGIALVVFGGRPQMIDEVSQLLHASAYASGWLSWPTATPVEFFSSLEIVNAGGRSFSHFPAGGPAMLAIGVALGAPWVIGPLCGAGAVLAFGSIVRKLEPRPGIALAATLLFAFAPFMMFMSGTHMNHIPTLMWCLVGVWALLKGTESSTPLPLVALVGGFGFGAAATIRPVDGFVFALPAAAWYLSLALGDRRRWVDAVAAAVGVALPVAALMWANWNTTGAPLRFAYELLWGSEVGPGFHGAPWGEPHTPLRGLELINLYFFRLGKALYETPFPGVLPAIIALGLMPRLRAPDRYLLVSSGLLVGSYFMYWADGGYLGPRFFIPLLPACAIWTARFLPAVRERWGPGIPYRAAAYSVVVGVAITVTLVVPRRIGEYARRQTLLAWDGEAAARRAGVTDALVLVREPWADQRLVRMWRLGISRTDAWRLQAYVDRCVLEEGLTRLERENVQGPAALAMLSPLLRDSALVIPRLEFGQRAEATLPGLSYSDHCKARVADDREGVAALAGLLQVHDDGNVFARDLHARDTLLLEAFPHRPVFLVRATAGAAGWNFRFEKLSRDSLWVKWAGHGSPGACTHHAVPLGAVADRVGQCKAGRVPQAGAIDR